MARGILTRFPALAGLATGFLTMGAVVTVLAVVGVIGTEGLHATLAPQLYIWDTHGHSDRTLWESINPQTEHRFADARDIHVQSGYASVVYGGSSRSPATFSARSLDAGSSSIQPPLPRPGFDSGPVDLQFPNNQNAVFDLSPDHLHERLEVQGTATGIAWRASGTGSRKPVGVGRLAAGWSVEDENGMLGPERSASSRFQMVIPPLAMRAIVTRPNANGIAMLASRPVRLLVDSGRIAVRPEAAGTKIYLSPLRPTGGQAARAGRLAALQREAINFFGQP
jgi:hypothetical protein